MQQPATAPAADGDRSWPEAHLLHGTAALSLKSRETAALFLKRIFEQHLQSSTRVAAKPCSFAAHHDTIKGHDQYTMQHQVDLELRLSAPSTTASLSSHTELSQSSDQLLQMQSTEPLLEINDTDHRDNSLTSKITGPLTLFYSGTVRVFDNVPADKAKAILLLAAGSTGEQSYMAEGNGNGSFGMGTACKSRPSTPDIVSSRSLKPRARSQAELPFARKASLARFLEKRKDRIEGQANGPNVESIKDGDISK